MGEADKGAHTESLFIKLTQARTTLSSHRTLEEEGHGYHKPLPFKWIMTSKSL